MTLSHELISQFAKIVKNDKKQSAESTIYGTVVTDGNGNKYVKLDGSDQLTPLTDDERPILDSTTASANEGERVSVLIKNHTATVTGNISSPSVRSADFKDLDDTVSDIQKFNIIISDEIQANKGYIQQLQADKATIGDLTAATARITELETKKASVEELNAAKGEITDLKTTKIDTEVANATYATIENLNATNADIANLGAKYANIDFSNIGKAAIEQFYATSGIIKDLVIGDTSVTGQLVGVTITGDLIEGGTVKADKLVILGEDGLYYKLNVNSLGETTASSDPKYRTGLDGSVIVAKSITGEKVNVHDLVAFDATIGGFNIDDNSIYSGVKKSIDNTTKGSYLDKDGQIAFGDANNFIKYYKNSDGQYQLEISANSIFMTTAESSGSENLDTMISQNKSAIEELSQPISNFFEFNSNGLTIGSKQNSLKLVLDNNQIGFFKNGSKIAWWDGNYLRTGNLEIKVDERAQFGNFAVVPRSDGSLMFLKVSDTEVSE